MTAHLRRALMDGVQVARRKALEHPHRMRLFDEETAEEIAAALDRAGYKIVRKPRTRRNKNWRRP